MGILGGFEGRDHELEVRQLFQKDKLIEFCFPKDKLGESIIQ